MTFSVQFRDVMNVFLKLRASNLAGLCLCITPSYYQLLIRHHTSHPSTPSTITPINAVHHHNYNTVSLSTLSFLIQSICPLRLFNLKSMGPSPSQSKPQASGQSQVLVMNHPRFGNLRVVRVASEQDEGAIEVTVALPSEAEFKRWQKQLSSLSDSENLFLPSGQRFDKTEFCGSGGVSTVTFRYYPYLLCDEILNRNNMDGKCFEEAELWYLVFSIIHAASAFHSNGSKIGDVRPLNVFISPEGQVRVATQFSWPNEQTNYLKTVFEKEPTYLSPEQLKDIGYGKLQESANFALNQAFSVGLTCLDAATLSDASSLYEPNNKFNYSKLEERLEQLQVNGNYSAPLVLLIKGLCQVEAEKRPTCRELGEWLTKYESSIIELQEFTINELPDKLHRLSQSRAQPPRVQAPLPIPNQQFTYQPQYTPQVPTGNFVSAPVPRSELRFTETSVVKPGYIPQQYVPPPPPAAPVYSEYGSQGMRSTYEYQSRVGGGSINLQQIDEQLQMSRKLFPS